MKDASGKPLNASERRITIIALLASALIIGVAFGGLAPLVALVMEKRGISTLVIGLNSAMSPIGVIIMSIFTPKLIRMIGSVNTLILGNAVTLLAILMFTLSDDILVWFALRLMIGFGLAPAWVVAETWLNMSVPASIRGRVMAVYTMLLAAGFAAGPVVISWIGSDGALPYLIFAVFVGLSAVPVFWIRHLAPDMAVPEHTTLKGLAIAAPTAFAAAMVSGVTDAATFSFLPLYGLRVGFAESHAVTLLSIYLAGNLLLQYPLGWLADHVSRRGALLLCGAACVLGPALAPLIYENSHALWLVLFVWGGGAWAIYGIALAMLGDRFPGGQLTAANAAFVMAFEMANIIGPPVSGYVINIFEPHGLMIFLCIVGVLFVVVAAERGIVRRLKKDI